MRIEIKFELKNHNQFLPFNYQYPVSAWIYKVLAQGNEEFTTLLHNEGYQLNNGKTFKLFTFSNLRFPKGSWSVADAKQVNILRKEKGFEEISNSDRMKIWSRNAWLTVSFHLPQQSENFIMGLFKNQKAFIGDKISGINLEVESIEALKPPTTKNGSVKIKSSTPILMGLNEEGFKHERYINPTHPAFKTLFINNLLNKYHTSGKTDIKLEDIDFEVIKLYPKPSKQTIKAFTKEQTEVKAFKFDFELKAPNEIIEIGLNAGFGSMNSLGFGFGDVYRQD
jgi:CRISPR-associated endoribonuclease Cas6